MLNGISSDIETDDITDKPLYLYEYASKNDSQVFDYSCKKWYVDSVTWKRTHVMNEILPLKNGKFEGRYYYPNGKPEMVIKFDTIENYIVSMANEGTYIEYYPNGNKKSEGASNKQSYIIKNSWDSLGKPEVVNGNGVSTEYECNYGCCNKCIQETYYRNGFAIRTISKCDNRRNCHEDYKAVDNSDSLSILYYPNGEKQQESFTDKHNHFSKTIVWDTNGHIKQENIETDTIELFEHTDEYQKIKRELVPIPLNRSMTSYFPNGQKLYEEITSRHNKSERQWDESGKLIKETIYQYDEFGNLLNKTTH